MVENSQCPQIFYNLDVFSAFKLKKLTLYVKTKQKIILYKLFAVLPASILKNNINCTINNI